MELYVHCTLGMDIIIAMLAFTQDSKQRVMCTHLVEEY